MFLQKLELQGFKSFVDKTTLLFGDGITGVVGPNGCGKTNVSDAIRWVMGEQSAKQLRGGSMEDVIFNGSPKRKPVGMAEVHLTLLNDRGILPTEFTEVTISRKVFRSGLSEYFINKSPCRLRDVRDLFFDTGMGSHAYSVIERQMVDQVLSDNSGHRRFLFEEASGITKYKARKREALNKLSSTEDDLERLNDIMFEIERELRSLARQVGKARRFQRLRDEIRDLDLKLTAENVADLKQRETGAHERWQEEAVRREGVSTELDALEAQLNDKKLTLLELERELSTAQSGLRDREEGRARAEQEIVLFGERAAGLKRRAKESGDEMTRMRERLEAVLASEREAETRREALSGERETAQSGAEKIEAELLKLENELKQHRGVEAERKQLSLDLFSTESVKRGACERLRDRQTVLEERGTAAHERLDEMETRLRELAKSGTEASERRAVLEGELQGARAGLADVERRIADVEHEIQQTQAGLGEHRQRSAAAESRLDTLLELKRNFEGISDGVKGLLSEPDRPRGLLGVVADVLEVPSRYLMALEASLGEASAFVLVDGPAALDAALDLLRRLDNGRATLIDLAQIARGTLAEVPHGDGVVGRASELVRCDERYRPLIDRLLGGVVVVEDRAAAARHAGRAESGLRFVSLDGEVWERGRVRAGSSRALSGLLHREQGIRELTGQIAEFGLLIEGLVREHQALDARRSSALADRSTALEELEARRTAVETLHHEAEARERESAWADHEASERRREIETIEAELETLGRTRTEVEAELGTFQRELGEARARVADAEQFVRDLEAKRDDASKRAQASREVLLRVAREAGEWESRWARAEQTRRELEGGIEARQTDERHALASVGEIAAQVQGLSAGLQGLVSSESEQRDRVAKVAKQFQALKDEAASGEEDAKKRRFEQTELNEFLHQIELDRVQARAELDRTLERLRTEYEMDPEAWTPEPMPEDFDREGAGQALEAKRTKFRSLGPVNMLALEEYTKKKERHQFLVKQRADLTDAKAQLLEAIDKINRSASQLFAETFEKVQGHFRDVFMTLFEGGDAELRMVSDDPLESEIEIVAKPRGKHLQNITLMSGGERALTAIALLFALYLVKPSPFCLLDEVDAPLDDANVERFLNMLRRFSDKTQFVVITHNKKTMEAASSLYGVTMQELGVSTLVSVKFDRPEEAKPESAELAEATV